MDVVLIPFLIYLTLEWLKVYITILAKVDFKVEERAATTSLVEQLELYRYSFYFYHSKLAIDFDAIVGFLHEGY